MKSKGSSSKKIKGGMKKISKIKGAGTPSMMRTRGC